MKTIFLNSLAAWLLASIACGAIYPLSVTLLSQAIFEEKANGSLIFDKENHVRGSLLLGQRFSGDRFFHGRPSASEYGTYPSAASNLSPASSSLRDKINDRTRQNGFGARPVPFDLLTASGSGLDPDISYESAVLQIQKVAAATHISEARIAGIVRNISRPQLPLFSNPRIVNVVMLNRVIEGESGR